MGFSHLACSDWLKLLLVISPFFSDSLPLVQLLGNLRLGAHPFHVARVLFSAYFLLVVVEQNYGKFSELINEASPHFQFLRLLKSKEHLWLQAIKTHSTTKRVC